MLLLISTYRFSQPVGPEQFLWMLFDKWSIPMTAFAPFPECRGDDKRGGTNDSNRWPFHNLLPACSALTFQENMGGHCWSAHFGPDWHISTTCWMDWRDVSSRYSWSSEDEADCVWRSPDLSYSSTIKSTFVLSSETSQQLDKLLWHLYADVHVDLRIYSNHFSDVFT